jgi:hypothetical protein
MTCKGMINNRMTKIMISYIPNGRRRLGRTLKGLLDDEETGKSRANMRRMMMMTITTTMMIFETPKSHVDP